jgi:hypothetical protein
MHYDKIQNKKFRKMYKETEDNSSPLRGLFKNLHYRAGASSFTKYNGEYTERMTPGVVSHKGEMPRGEFIDPIGQKKERLLWQNFKRRQ